jgi:thiamine kinase-like enzyme
MNHNQLKALNLYFNLQATKQVPQRVHGGLMHSMWKIIEKYKVYAIKQLSKNINLNDENVVRNYNITEEIASRFGAFGIPTVSAIKHLDRYLYITEGTGFIVYNWVTGKIQKTVSETHAIKIAEILAKIHLINLDVPEIAGPYLNLHTNDKITELASNSMKLNCSFAQNLNENLEDIVVINDTYKKFIPTLKKHYVVSHGDLDQKNVLWDRFNNPNLIDWECAGRLNPTQEIINTSLDWSGIETIFDKEIFAKMINAYQREGGIINEGSLEASFYGSLGNWINWMVYNIERFLNPKDIGQKAISLEQVNSALVTIPRLHKLIPELIKIGKS